jgi:hypothetical protein
MKRILILCVLFSFTRAAVAQQLAASSFFEMYGVLHNPATAGSLGTGASAGSDTDLFPSLLYLRPAF